MSQDSNRDRGPAAITRAEPKSPLERAQQIQEMQRRMESQPLQHTATQPPPQVQEAARTEHAEKPKEVFEPKKVEATAVLGGLPPQGADQLGYGATQVDERALFGLGASNDVEVVGNPWRIIPFGEPPEHQLSQVLDLKRPLADYVFDVPPNAVKLKTGLLFEVGVKPKAGGGEPARRQAVVVDKQGNLKGTDFKSVAALQKGLTTLPKFALGLFAAVFGEGLTRDDPERMKVLHVGPGKKSAYEAVLEYRSPLDGKKREKTVTLNNFGMKVAESTDRQRFDIITRMYRLDSFDAAPGRQA